MRKINPKLAGVLNLKTKTPEHRETSSEKLERLQEELRVEREAENKRLREEKAKEKKVKPTREELLKAGWIRAQLRRGYERPWVYFTVPEWEELGTENRMKYHYEVSNEPGNHFTFSSTGKAGKGRRPQVISSLSHPRSY